MCNSCVTISRFVEEFTAASMSECNNTSYVPERKLALTASIPVYHIDYEYLTKLWPTFTTPYKLAL